MSNTNLFAKTFEIDGRQVLVTKEYNAEEDSFDLKMRTDTDGNTIEINNRWTEDEERRDKAFTDFNEVTAKSFLVLVDEMAGPSDADQVAIEADRNQNQ